MGVRRERKREAIRGQLGIFDLLPSELLCYYSSKRIFGRSVSLKRRGGVIHFPEGGKSLPLDSLGEKKAYRQDRVNYCGVFSCGEVFGK